MNLGIYHFSELKNAQNEDFLNTFELGDDNKDIEGGLQGLKTEIQ